MTCFARKWSTVCSAAAVIALSWTNNLNCGSFLNIQEFGGALLHTPHFPSPLPTSAAALRRRGQARSRRRSAAHTPLRPYLLQRCSGLGSKRFIEVHRKVLRTCCRARRGRPDLCLLLRNCGALYCGNVRRLPRHPKPTKWPGGSDMVSGRPAAGESSTSMAKYCAPAASRGGGRERGGAPGTLRKEGHQHELIQRGHAKKRRHKPCRVWKLWLLWLLIEQMRLSTSVND